MTDEQLAAFLTARAAPAETAGLEFKILPFLEVDGTGIERAVPFTDGRPPRETSIPDERGKLINYTGECVSARLRYVPA